MTTIIRHSVFETNSSSCHSLTIKKGILTDISVNPSCFNNGALKSYLKRYDWNQVDLTTFDEKLDYCLTYICCVIQNANKLEQFLSIIHNVLPFECFYCNDVLLAEYNVNKHKIIISDDFKSFCDDVSNNSLKYGIIEDSNSLLTKIFDKMDDKQIKSLLFIASSTIHIDHDGHDNFTTAKGDDIQNQWLKIFSILLKDMDIDAKDFYQKISQYIDVNDLRIIISDIYNKNCYKDIDKTIYMFEQLTDYITNNMEYNEDNNVQYVLNIIQSLIGKDKVNSTEIENVIQILNNNNIEQIVEKHNIKFNDFISEDYIVFYLLLWNKLNHNIDWELLEKENGFDYYN